MENNSLLKYFNSLANDTGSVSTVVCGHWMKWEEERGHRKEEERLAAVSSQEVREEGEEEEKR